MRTFKEIVEKIKSSTSLFGFDAEVMVGFLPFEYVKPLLANKEAKAEDWEVREYTREAVIKEMASYLEFAWEKVQDHRGLSAERSVEKIGAYLWLLGDDEVLARFEAMPYPKYGAPQLKVAADAYRLPVPDSPDVRNMCEGMPCVPGCEQGCLSFGLPIAARPTAEKKKLLDRFSFSWEKV